MPLLQLHLSDQGIENSTKDYIHRFGAKILSEEIGKSIDFVLVVIKVSPGRYLVTRVYVGILFGFGIQNFFFKFLGKYKIIIVYPYKLSTGTIRKPDGVNW